jgi:hypothetical protein
LYVGFGAPHDPYIVPGQYLDRVPLDSLTLPANFYDTLTDKPRVYQRMRQQIIGQLTEREVREGDAMIKNNITFGLAPSDLGSCSMAREPLLFPPRCRGSLTALPGGAYKCAHGTPLGAVADSIHPCSEGDGLFLLPQVAGGR